MVDICQSNSWQNHKYGETGQGINLNEIYYNKSEKCTSNTEIEKRKEKSTRYPAPKQDIKVINTV